jgi:hypothetical protein
MSESELSSGRVIKGTDGDDPKWIAYDKGDTVEANQASTRSFDWAAVITIVVCGIVFSSALSRLLLGLRVRLKTLLRIAKFSQHEADGRKF